MASSEYIERLKAIPLVDILHEVYGIETHRHGGRHYCKIRDERTASCCIYPDNTWYDFGGSVGGDTIDLIETMEHCDRKVAMEKLGELYHIEREYTHRDPSILMDYEWKKLGIEPDRVSKNLNINILDAPNGKRSRFADIYLDPTNAEQIAAFQEKYMVSINEFRQKDSPSYHRILREKVFYPLMEERDQYLASLHSEYQLVCEVDPQEAFRITASNPANQEQAEALGKKAMLLRRAVDDISLLRVPELKLNPERDLRGILDGSTRYQVSKLPYYGLCRYARICGDNLSSVTVPYDLYAQKHYPEKSKLRGIPHYAEYQNHECTVYCMDKYLQQLQSIFEGEILSQKQYFKPYAYEKRGGKTKNPPQNRV